jgi:hypothetical protein
VVLDFLERHHVRIQFAQHMRGSIRLETAVNANAGMYVVGGERHVHGNPFLFPVPLFSLYLSRIITIAEFVKTISWQFSIL